MITDEQEEVAVLEDVERRVQRPRGIEIPYRVLGTGAPPRMVFAHAITASGMLADPALFAPFLDAGWTVVVLDQCGHATATPSTDPADYHVHELAGDLLAVVEDLGWSSAWLCGASMGTAPSICATVLDPERVDGLILLAPAFGADRNAAADDFARIADAVVSGGIEAGSAAWRAAMEARGLPDPTIEQHLAQLRLHDASAMGVWLREMTSWTIRDELEALAALDLPVAVVVWEGDDIHPAVLGRGIAAAAPRGACEVIDLGKPGVDPDILFRTAVDVVHRLAPAGRVELCPRG